MHLSEKALREFKETYEQEFGEELTDAEALECAQRVVSFVELLVRASNDEGPQASRRTLTQRARSPYDEDGITP